MTGVQTCALPISTLVEHFRKAVTTHSARAAYLVQEARRMKEIDPSFLVVMEGALLASFGAVPESLAATLLLDAGYGMLPDAGAGGVSDHPAPRVGPPRQRTLRSPWINRHAPLPTPRTEAALFRLPGGFWPRKLRRKEYGEAHLSSHSKLKTVCRRDLESILVAVRQSNLRAKSQDPSPLCHLRLAAIRLG